MIKGIWDRETVALLWIAAAFPVAVTWFFATGLEGLLRLAFFLVVAGLWHLVWMLARAQPPSFAGALTALTIAVLAPLDAGALALLLATSFGIVMAELAFGGWGRNVLNPATVTLAFLGFGYPGLEWPMLPVQMGWAGAMTAMVACLFGVASILTVVSALLAVLLAQATGLHLGVALPATLVVFALITLDPVTNASTALGRVFTGLTFAGLVVLFATYWTGAPAIRISVSAALLTSLAAPLFDEIAIALWLAIRRRRLG